MEKDKAAVEHLEALQAAELAATAKFDEAVAAHNQEKSRLELSVRELDHVSAREEKRGDQNLD